jgi:micrococcal nuclease
VEAEGLETLNMRYFSSIYMLTTVLGLCFCTLLPNNQQFRASDTQHLQWAQRSQDGNITAPNEPGPESTFLGKVVGIIDGDTIKVMHAGVAENIRLSRIDCLEKEQSFGTKAKLYTSDLYFQKEVTVIPKGHDRFRRTVAEITLPDGNNLNYELVKAGYAWWYPKYALSDTRLEQLESAAHKCRLGLWNNACPIPPWEFDTARIHQYRLLRTIGLTVNFLQLEV